MERNLGLFPEWTWVMGLLIGAAFGSFLNVVIYRMPLGMSLSEPKHSFCPNCKHQLTILDLFPLFSWLLLRGKCRHCGVKVPSRYFWVEVITGSLWAVVWHQHLIVNFDVPKALLYFAVICVLVAATFIDLKWFIIPDELNALLFGFGMLYAGFLAFTGKPEAIGLALLGAFVGFLSIWLITLLGRLFFGKDAMGHGDIKLMRGLGACLLPAGVGATFGLSILSGAIIGVLMILIVKLQNKPDPDVTVDEEEPYVPESIGSIFKCGLGYLLLIDIVGLFFPKLYKSWFGEDPFAHEDIEDDWEPGLTHIPFGPHLALGAVGWMLFQPQITQLFQSYLRYVGIK